MIKKLLKLNVDRSKGAPAPHKAILLLTIIQSIECEEIRENKVFITPELVARFRDNWNLLVHDNRFNPNFSLPFYHLKSDGFWYLMTLPGREILLTSSASIRSFTSLKDAIAYAYFDDTAYQLLMDQRSRTIVKDGLLTSYLNSQQLKDRGYGLFQVLENEILHEPSEAYQKVITVAEEEVAFIRGGAFKKVVPRAYNNTCCISGMKVIATRDVQMIDACHIVPISEKGIDHIKNGLSLSPNFHRAFDRFLIAINNNFEVVVSSDFIETENHSFRVFHGKKILLPDNEDHYPSVDNLNWHYERFISLHS